MYIMGTHRALNKGEILPCTVKCLKERFSNTEISISICLTKKYSFDSASYKRPIIKGAVIASLELNNRESRTGTNGILSIFPIQRTMYAEKDRAMFDSVYIDKLRRWYEVHHKGEVMINCVENILVEFYDGAFYTHSFTYQ